MAAPTPLENLRSILDGGNGRWVPFSMAVGSQPGLSEPVMRTFRTLTGASDPCEYFDADEGVLSPGGVPAGSNAPLTQPLPYLGNGSPLR